MTRVNVTVMGHSISMKATLKRTCLGDGSREPRFPIRVHHRRKRTSKTSYRAGGTWGTEVPIDITDGRTRLRICFTSSLAKGDFSTGVSQAGAAH